MAGDAGEYMYLARYNTLRGYRGTVQELTG